MATTTTTGFTIEPRGNTATTHALRGTSRNAPAKGDFFAELAQARRDVPTKEATKPADKGDRQPEPRAEAKPSDENATRAADRSERPDRDEPIEATTDETEPTATDDESPVAAVTDDDADTTDADRQAGESDTDEQGDEPEAADGDAVVLTALVVPAASANIADEATSDAAGETPLAGKLPAIVVNGSAPAVVTDGAAGEEGVVAEGVSLESIEGLELGDEAVTELTPEPAQTRLAPQQSRGTADGDEAAADAPPAAAQNADAATTAVAELESTPAFAEPAPPSDAATAKPISPDPAQLLSSQLTSARQAPADPRVAAAAAPQLAPEAHFAQANHEKIVTGVSGQMLTNGGTMQIRLDPPHLGPLAVSVHMRDGIVTASFETQNDEATKLLSHSLSQLKSALEAQGLSVDKLQVQQAPKNQESGNDSPNSRQQDQQALRDQASEQQQQKQRQEMLRRMWQRVNGDPIDLVA